MTCGIQLEVEFDKASYHVFCFLFGTCSFIFKEEKVRDLTRMNDFYHLARRGHKGEKDDKQSLYSGVWVLFCVSRVTSNQKDTKTSADISQNT